MSKAVVTFPAGGTPYALDIEDEGSLIVANPSALNFKGAGVTVTENPTGEAEITINGVQFWTESESAAIQQNTRWIPNNAAANVSAVVEPKGNGAFSLQRPDGLATGGNARGQFAVDLQLQRSSAAAVASGNHSFAANRNNLASGTSSSAFGNGSSATGQESFAAVIGTASGLRSVGMGTNALASGSYSASYGGLDARSTGIYSLAHGEKSTAYRSNHYAFGFSGSMLQAQMQHGNIAIGTNQNVPELTTGASTTVGDLLPFSSNRIYNLVSRWCAVVTGIIGTATGVNVGDYIIGEDVFGLKNLSGTPTITAITNIANISDTSMSTSALNYSISGSVLRAAFLAPVFAGGGTLQIRIALVYDVVEIGF